MKRVVITHLTRMDHPRVCVAGIDVDSGQYIRPVTWKSQPLTLEAVKSGLLRLGQMIELGSCRMVGSPPEVEDCLFSLQEARALGQVTPEEFWSRLADSAQESLEQVFGEELRRYGATLALPEGRGKASLGDVWVEGFRLVLRKGNDGRPRLRGRFAGLSVAVTDLRFYESSTYGLEVERVNWVNRTLRDSRAILSVGLSRPMKREQDPEPLHWLQVNGVHLECEPLWVA